MKGVGPETVRSGAASDSRGNRLVLLPSAALAGLDADALGRMGDRESIDAVKKFKDSLSTTQKLFVGGALKKAVDDVISRPPE